MNFELTQQQAAIQETARKFEQEELPVSYTHLDVYKRQRKSFTKQAKGAGTILNDLSDDEAVAAIVEKLQEKHII